MSKYRDDLPSGALHNMMEYIEDYAWEDAVSDLLMGKIGDSPYNWVPGEGNYDNPDREPNVIAGDKVTLDDLEEVYDYFCYDNSWSKACHLTWNKIVKNARDRIE